MKDKTSKKAKTDEISATIKVDALARIEGEAAFTVKIKDSKVIDAKLRVFEPPRFFEAFLRGRRYHEAPDITSRICGICPIAYQMSSIHAMESAFAVKVSPQIRELRRLFYCGEWIESHALHIFMLHAPDFLGYEDTIQLAKDHPDVVKMALDIKKLGNDIVKLLGAREIHPLSACVGGFYKVPTKKALQPLIERLRWAIEASVKTVKFTSQLTFPDLEKDYEFVSLRHPNEYPLCEGRIVSSKGLDIAVSEYEDYFEEEHVKQSTSLHSFIKGRGEYLVGPLARFNLNFDKLTPRAQAEAKAVGLMPPCKNNFKSIIVRAVELLYACEEALRIIEGYEMPEPSRVEVHPIGTIGHGATEAPRGILYHRYTLDERGTIRSAKIVPPTSQNQKIIEKDLTDFVSKNLTLPKEKLGWQCEQLIRNYDPCISCSCHFLKLNVEEQ
ncbi:MAG: Ni/Fe hydrogenase subunit alpha [bacterium]|nr:Ni/Fe hydrogenase subunit alpha [bacterium]